MTYTVRNETTSTIIKKSNTNYKISVLSVNSSRLILFIDKKEIDCGYGSILQGFSFSNKDFNTTLQFWCQLSDLVSFNTKKITYDYFDVRVISNTYSSSYGITCPDGFGLHNLKFTHN